MVQPFSSARRATYRNRRASRLPSEHGAATAADSSTMRAGLRTALAVLVLLASTGHAMKLLGLFPHTGRSHQMVFEPLLRVLAERGHSVTVVSFFPLERPPPGYRDVSLEGIAPPGIETINMSVFEDTLWGFERIAEQFLGFHPLAEMALEVCRRLVDWPPLVELFQETTDYDLILVENFNSDCLLGLARAHGVRAPVVALLSSSLMPWSFERLGVPFNPAYVPVVSTSFTGRLKFADRLENSLMHIYFNVWYRYMIQTKEQSIIEKRFKRKITDLQVMAKETCLMLVNTHHSLLGVRPLLPGVVEVGGMHIEPPKDLIPSVSSESA
ncbi:UDP-glucuronosyltransferase 2B30 [Eumeta japonica]|uniref:UDP-glucuronosyltransferase 2B30 n=1 Tax=Eumeta variegata TaxID=151549 RepID=A0A4C1YEV8_EUMVA|nr:UDP-glucuronosyltransferase 2B30 [Eumeta japonica]